MNKFIKYPDDLAMLVKSNVLESFKNTYINIHDIVLNDLNILKLDEFFAKALKKKYKKKLTIEKYGENFKLYEWKDGCGRQIRNFKTIEEVINIKEIFKDSYILYLKNNIDYTSLEILLCEIVLDENKDFIISERNRFNLKQEKEKIIKLYNKGKEIDIKTLKNLIPENTVLCTNCKNISNFIFSTFSYKDSFEKVIDYLISLIDCRYLDLDIFSEKDFANKNPYYTNKDFPNPDTIYELSEISKSIYKEYFL